MGDQKSAHKIFVGKHQEKIPLERSRYLLECDIKCILEKDDSNVRTELNYIYVTILQCRCPFLLLEDRDKADLRNVPRVLSNNE
jgi:hypothetical protein